VVSTSFALLFLSRSNLARDLSQLLKGRIRDGEARLKSEGFPKAAEPRRTATEGNRGAAPSGPVLRMPSHTAEQTGLTDDIRGSEDALTIGKDLITASAERQSALIEKLRDTLGSANTEALAQAIAKLEGPVKLKAQDALAERLSRMKPSTLQDKLQDENAEVRRAAALACAMKRDKDLVPEVIKLLSDQEARVARAAHRALQLLTGEDFGWPADGTPVERANAIERWRSYWAKQQEADSDPERRAARESDEDHKRLTGDWLLTAMETDGQIATKQLVSKLKMELTFSGNEYVLRSALTLNTGKFTITANLRPKEIDLDNGKEISRGIYTIEGDELKICFVPDGPHRPRLFTTKPLSKQILWVLKRSKSK
jgi:uncharacterized protein (TIGR03067 family)